jgi:hypothetical protein
MRILRNSSAIRFGFQAKARQNAMRAQPSAEHCAYMKIPQNKYLVSKNPVLQELDQINSISVTLKSEISIEIQSKSTKEILPVYFDYSEKFAVVRDTETIDHEMTVGDFYQKKAQYYAKDEIGAFLNSLNPATFCTEMECPPDEQLIQEYPVFDYVCEITFEKGNKRTVSGRYSYYSLPVDWIDFIESLKQLQSYFPGSEIFNAAHYARVNRLKSESVFAYVIFEPEGEEHCYLCSDPGIEAGNCVLVAGEGEESVKAGTVSRIEFHTLENAPLPVENLSWILRKLDDGILSRSLDEIDHPMISLLKESKAAEPQTNRLNPPEMKHTLLQLLSAFDVEVFTDQNQQTENVFTLIISNPNGGKSLEIWLESEFTLAFAGWHKCYHASIDGYQKMLADMLSILSGQTGAVDVYSGMKWQSSFLCTRMEKEIYDEKEAMQYFHLPSFVRKSMKVNGGMIEISFWNPENDRLYELKQEEDILSIQEEEF